MYNKEGTYLPVYLLWMGTVSRSFLFFFLNLFLSFDADLIRPFHFRLSSCVISSHLILLGLFCGGALLCVVSCVSCDLVHLNFEWAGVRRCRY